MKIYYVVFYYGNDPYEQNSCYGDVVAITDNKKFAEFIVDNAENKDYNTYEIKEMPIITTL